MCRGEHHGGQGMDVGWPGLYAKRLRNPKAFSG